MPKLEENLQAVVNQASLRWWFSQKPLRVRSPIMHAIRSPVTFDTYGHVLRAKEANLIQS
jgi:hypothetical protein